MTPIERLENLVAEAIQVIQSDRVSPTEALLKVAKVHNLKPGEVELVAGHLNTSRHLVHMVKSNGAQRIEGFPLADAEKVNAILAQGTSVLRNPEKKETREAEKRMAEDIEKSIEKKKQIPRTGKKSSNANDLRGLVQIRIAVAEDFSKLEEEFSKLVKRLAITLENDASKIETELESVFEFMADSIKRRAVSERSTFVRRLVSKYGDAGRGLTSLVFKKAGVEDISNSVSMSAFTVMPSDVLYLKAEKAMDLGKKLINVSNNLELLNHRAFEDSLTEDFLATLSSRMVGDWVSSTSQTGQEFKNLAEFMKENKLRDYLGEDVSLDTQLKLKGLRTRNMFMNIVLDDPVLRGYPMTRLAKAFNSAVQIDPALLHRPTILRATMYNMLASSTPDLFAVKTVAEVGSKAAQQMGNEQAKRKKRKETIEEKVENMVNIESKMQEQVESALEKAKKEKREETQYRRAEKQYKRSERKALIDRIKAAWKTDKKTDNKIDNKIDKSQLGGIDKIIEEHIPKGVDKTTFDRVLQIMANNGIDVKKNLKTLSKLPEQDLTTRDMLRSETQTYLKMAAELAKNVDAIEKARTQSAGLRNSRLDFKKYVDDYVRSKTIPGASVSAGTKEIHKAIQASVVEDIITELGKRERGRVIGNTPMSEIRKYLLAYEMPALRDALRVQDPKEKLNSILNQVQASERASIQKELESEASNIKRVAQQLAKEMPFIEEIL